MARQATGQVIERNSKQGITYAARVRAYGQRHYISLGYSWKGDTRRQAETELQNILFAGCGGLALGFESVGFRTLGFELSDNAATSYNENLRGECIVERLNVESELPSAPVIIGGPPCQPFSNGGMRRADQDKRDGFPAFLAAVRKIEPEVAIIENVRGLMTGDHSWYFLQTLNNLREFGYVVDSLELNAAEHGVPQRRQRVFIVAHRGGLMLQTRRQRQPLLPGRPSQIFSLTHQPTLAGSHLPRMRI